VAQLAEFRLRFLERSDDLALFADISDKDVEQLKPYSEG